MAKADGVFIYIGTYPNEAAARADYDVAKDLHALGAIGTYDAAVIKKDASGKVHVNKEEMATRHGGWGGAWIWRDVGAELTRREVPWTAVDLPSSIHGAHPNTFLADDAAGICEVLLAPEQSISPKASAFARPDGTFESRPLEDMAPFLPRDEAYANMHLFDEEPAAT